MKREILRCYTRYQVDQYGKSSRVLHTVEIVALGIKGNSVFSWSGAINQLRKMARQIGAELDGETERALASVEQS